MPETLTETEERREKTRVRVEIRTMDAATVARSRDSRTTLDGTDAETGGGGD